MGYDLSIHDVTIFDGTGAESYVASVTVNLGKIVSIGAPEKARCTIDGHGLALAPGFIDVHTHDDVALIATPDMRNKIRQGVTTVVTGLCGYSAAPFPKGKPPPQEYGILLRNNQDTFETFSDYLEAVEKARPALNWLPLVGHSTLRIAAMEDLNRTANDEEICTMSRLLRDAMEVGAAGLSTGLAYDMAVHAQEDEIVYLARNLQEFAGLHVTHIRDEADGLIDATMEALRIGRRANVGTVFSHHKTIGSQNWGATQESLEIIDNASSQQEIALDAYPYTFSSTSLTPARARRGGKVTITRSDPMPSAAGRDLDEIAKELGFTTDQAVEALMPAGALFHSMCEDDVCRVLSHPKCMIGSDGLPFDPVPHPRLTDSFPRVLGHYVRDHKVLTLPEAIRKMTSLPAQVFGLKSRGVIELGNAADLVLFDPSRIREGVSLSNFANGIEAVIVNGVGADKRSGQRLRSHRSSTVV
ncbi:D-aminoacylase [Roseibium denhamense]|uniref:N-acyl-D-amino-acid deacylase n=1 Tax=Roseibium denhamense TaxID=76305 RepID=A0ABY1NDE2_9HYPH|nr:D-aminoacylase [Roseibium denhamense]MTI06669.1 D-aminoacylase [Roseibium denhamense]SMP06551.1 N-acyl-D-amino-acid deacylase [Roseibium denhamense]